MVQPDPLETHVRVLPTVHRRDARVPHGRERHCRSGDAAGARTTASSVAASGGTFRLACDRWRQERERNAIRESVKEAS